MIKPEDRLIEDVWYHVGLEDNPYKRETIKVETKQLMTKSVTSASLGGVIESRK